MQSGDSMQSGSKVWLTPEAISMQSGDSMQSGSKVGLTPEVILPGYSMTINGNKRESC